MSDKFVSERNLTFLLYETHKAQDLCNQPYYREHTPEVFEMALTTAIKLATEMLYPALREMDQKPPRLDNGQVKVHPLVREFLAECGTGGWISANAPFEVGGQQLPSIMTSAFHFVFGAANYSASVYPGLTTGAAHLIESFGTEDLIDAYLPNMFEGKWQGTMALTEPQAGSSLSDLVTAAEPTDQGYFKIRGQKIFISAGDHDAVENVAHLLLARIKGAPPGVRGISLFVVPKKRITGHDGLEPNDVTVTTVYHKLGYKGAPITQLSLGENDDCRGYLLGKPNEGLKYMFQMMNEARIGVGLGATAIASAAYHASLKYFVSGLRDASLRAKILWRRRPRSSITLTSGECCCSKDRSSRAPCP
jgi:alkylation response protein AidB-like acyl-CoA dehydrogenase